ncbi:MAG: hypothetical protein ACP5NZ_01070 [Nanobdellota archaeon]
MTRLSLETEPPPIFRGQKGINKKGKNLPQVIFSIRNEKNIDKSNQSRKTIEKNLKNSSIKESSNGDYSSMEITILDAGNTSFSNSVHFSKSSISDSNLISDKFDYLHLKENINSNKNNTGFYTLNSGYSFGIQNSSFEYEAKEERRYHESKENEEKERPYVIGVLEEEKKPVDEIRDRAIKWDPKDYN